MNRTSLLLGHCFALMLALLLWGCGTSGGKGVPFNPTTGEHPTTWLRDHWTEYIKVPEQCRTCHGSTTDPALAGGIAKVSCYSCHTQGPVHHAGWALPAQHGRLGAELAPVATTSPTVPVMAGFAHCTKCHGAAFDGGVVNVSCKACHTKAPHPAKPWYDASGAHPSHAQVNPANASECAKCHAGGLNSDLRPLTAAAAGTAPGCYNATLCHSNWPHSTTWIQDHWADYTKAPAQCRICHGSTTNPAQAGGVALVSCFSCHTTGVVHPTGWELPAQHGSVATQVAPVTTPAGAIPVMAGMAHCARCHGSNYEGGLSAVSCKSCHTTAPHPPKPWFSDSNPAVPSHDKTDVNNLPVCMGCHLHGGNSGTVPRTPAAIGTAPGCFNATLCHG